MPHTSRFRIFLTSVLLSSAALNPLTALADKQEVNVLRDTLLEQRGKMELQRRAIERQLQALEMNQKKLNEQIQSINKTEEKLIDALEQTGTTVDLTKSTAQESAQEDASSASDAPPSEVGTDRKPEDADRPPEITTLSDEGGVLLGKGNLLIEPGFEYSRSSALRVAIEGFTIIPALNIGSFEITQVDRDTFVTSVGLRYGITNRLEVSTKIPYAYRNDTTLARPIGTGTGQETLREVGGDGIGDIDFGVNYQLNRGKDGWPFLIANMRYKSATGEGPFDVPIDPDTGFQTELPTGSGFQALQPSLTMIMPSEPAIFFSNIGYLYNMSNNVGGQFGEIDPGDAVSFSLGMGLGINDRTSFNIAYSHSTVFETTQNGAKLSNTDVLQVGALDLGFAYRPSTRYGINFNVSAGLTDDAPDARVTLKLPIRFQLFGPEVQ